MKFVRVFMVIVLCAFARMNYAVGSGFTGGGVSASDVQTHLETLMSQVRSFNRTSTWEVTSSYAAADFASGVDPAVTLTAGTWKIRAEVCVGLNSAAAINNNQQVFLKLRRTNNTAEDLNQSEVTIYVSTHGATTPTYTATCVDVTSDDYTTTNSDDSITVFGDTTAGITFGSILVTYMEIYAQRIF